MVWKTMDKPTLRNIAVFLALLMICFGIIGYVLISGSAKIKENEVWVAHTNQVALKAQRMASLVEATRWRRPFT